MIIKDQEGNDIEVFSQEELQAKIDEQNKINEDKAKNFRSMETKMSKLEEELANANKKQEEIQIAALTEYKDDVIGSFTNDPEQKKIINEYFSHFKDGMENKEKIKEFVAKAAKLAGVSTENKDKFHISMNSSGAGNPAGYGGSEKDTYVSSETNNQKAMRDIFGISDEVANKYGTK